MEAQPLRAVHLTAEEVATLAAYQVFLREHKLERVLVCTACGDKAEPGTGQVGFKCGCRILVWNVPSC